MRLSRFHELLGCAAVVLAAACRTPTGPVTLSDPQATSAALASLDSMFTAPALASFASLSLSQDIVPSPLLQRAGQILEASPEGLIVPDSLYGSVFTWDSASARYARTAATGGPASGIRFILYAVSPPTGAVSFPLTPVGQTELSDEGVGQSEHLHIIVAGVGGTATYADYSGSLSGGGGIAQAGLVGSLSNGLSGGANRTLTFNVSATIAGATETVHAAYTLNDPSLAIILDVSDVRVQQLTDSVTLNFGFRRATELMSLSGLFVTTSGVLDTVAAGIGVNGHGYASVLGNAAGVTFYDNAGVPIRDSAGQHDVLVALADLRAAAIAVLELTAALLNPALPR
jgi:hypothetical protein